MKEINIQKYIVLLGILGMVGLAALWTDYIKDQTPPVFYSEMDVLTVSADSEDVDLLAGLTAEDDRNGDVTDSIVIEQMSRIKSDGSRTITYGAFDKSNNVAKYTRTLQYTDYVSPRFSLKEDLIFASWGLSDGLKRIQVTDCIDGDITNKMKLYSVEDVNTHNKILTVYITNSSGETVTQSFPVEILGMTEEEYYELPQLSLSQYLIYRQAGDAEENWAEYLTSVTLMNEAGEQADMTDLSMVEIQAEVDMDQPGTYGVTYTYTDEFGRTGKTRLFVIVEE